MGTSDDFEGGYSTYLGRDSSRDSLKFVETEAVTEHVRASCEAKGKSSAVCSRATHMAGPMLWCMASKHPYAVCAKQATSSLAGGTPSGAAHIGPGFASTLDQDSVHSEPGLGSTSGEAEGPRAVWES